MIPDSKHTFSHTMTAYKINSICLPVLSDSISFEEVTFWALWVHTTVRRTDGHRNSSDSRTSSSTSVCLVGVSSKPVLAVIWIKQPLKLDSPFTNFEGIMEERVTVFKF